MALQPSTLASLSPLTSLAPATSATVSVAPAAPQLPAWTSLVDHIQQYFYDPDLAALQITLAACISHFFRDSDSLGLFIIGPSGGDKTSIMINCALASERTELMGDLTVNTLLSGFTGAPNSSLLHRVGSGILVFKDFTTFLSKRAEDQGSIAAQFREVADGYYKRDTGKGIMLEWHGKMNFIAAATPALERKWAALGELGERFVQVRLARKKGVEQGEYAQKQSGMELFIRERMQQLTKDLFKSSPKIDCDNPPKLSLLQRHRVSSLAELVAHARAAVPRDPYKGTITGIANIENCGRMSKALNLLVSAHAALFRRSTPDDTSDLWLAARIAKNSIPINRWLLLRSLAKQQGGYLETPDLLQQSSLPESSLRYTLADLQSIGIVEGDSGSEGMANRYKFSAEFAKLWKDGFDSSSRPGDGNAGAA